MNATHNGSTALHRAVTNRNRKLIQYLIDNGANVNARVESGGTPLDWCGGDKRTSDILRKHSGKTSNELDNKKPEGKPAEDIAMQKKWSRKVCSRRYSLQPLTGTLICSSNIWRMVQK
jgi:ankyrin repeat protein